MVGPTASGKTALAVMLAKCFDGEVIGADSMQIYKGLDIGTAKPTAEEMRGIPHHCIDFLDPEKAFSAADYCAAAEKAEKEIAARGHLPILCGGTGLYVSSFLNGIRFEEDKVTREMRDRLRAEADRRGAAEMYRELCESDPEAAAAIHPNNTVRVLRALEYIRASGKRFSQKNKEAVPSEPPFRTCLIGLDFPDRKELYRRIDLRVDRMLEAGLLKEAEKVWRQREAYQTAAAAIGYKEFFPYFEGTAPVEACTDKLKQASRNYAKRQLTWFRRMEGVLWLDAGSSDCAEKAEQAVKRFLLKSAGAERTGGNSIGAEGNKQ